MCMLMYGIYMYIYHVYYVYGSARLQGKCWHKRSAASQTPVSLPPSIHITITIITHSITNCTTYNITATTCRRGQALLVLDRAPPVPVRLQQPPARAGPGLYHMKLVCV